MLPSPDLQRQRAFTALASAPFDVLVANLAVAPKRAQAQAIEDADWLALFDGLVHPLMRLVRGALPQMIARRSGKVVAITSAAPLRGLPSVSGYAAARGAQKEPFAKSEARRAPRGPPDWRR